MVRVLAVSDEVVESLWQPSARRLEPDLVVGCGDLPFDYLEYLQSTLDVPVVFVPGNHDPDLSGYRSHRGLAMRAGMPVEQAGPTGAVNADVQVVDILGLRIAGLGGCLRYRDGPNQYTEREQRRRARRLALRARWGRWRDHRDVDVLLTHAPPLGVGDGADSPHRGFAALHTLVDHLRPTLVLHGHVHPYGQPVVDRRLGTALVCNVVGYRVVDVAAGAAQKV